MIYTIKKSLKGQYLKITCYFMFTTLLLNIMKEGISTALPNNLYMQLLLLLSSMLGMIVLDTISILLLRKHREESFSKLWSIVSKKIPYFIITTFILSLFQVTANFFILYTSFLPMLYVVLQNFISFCFLLWNLLCVFYIIDNELSVLSILGNPLKVLLNQKKSVLLYSLPFLLWVIFGQQMLFTSLSSFFHDTSIFGNIILSLQAATSLMQSILIFFLYLFFYFIQFLLLVPIYMAFTIHYVDEQVITTKKKPCISY